MRRVAPAARVGFTRFNAGFTSRGGVYQTVAAVLVLVVLEATHVLPDTHGYWLLYWLTVYSVITQPALAAAARFNEEKLEAVLHRLKGADEVNAALLTQNAALLTRVVELLEVRTDDAGT